MALFADYRKYNQTFISLINVLYKNILHIYCINETYLKLMAFILNINIMGQIFSLQQMFAELV